MTDPRPSDHFEDAHDVDQPPPERDPGRPTGAPDEHGLRPGLSHEDAPTEAPEERGGAPRVENAPGGDL